MHLNWKPIISKQELLNIEKNLYLRVFEEEFPFLNEILG